MPEEKTSLTLFHRIGLLVLCIAVLLGLGAIGVITGPRFSSLNTAPRTAGDAIREGTAPIPALSPDVEQALSTSKGFQALISYTDRGFEPGMLSIKKGETVRFTNNSSNDLQVAIRGDSSSSNIAPQYFWEHTFEASGAYVVTNASDASKTGTVNVQ